MCSCSQAPSLTASRNRVLVGASLLQGDAQAATAVLPLTGTATLPWVRDLALVWGLGDGLIVPAETELVPQTVSAARLQQANALQRLSRSGVRVLGPALGGLLVVALSPSWALAVDNSLAFFVWRGAAGTDPDLTAGRRRTRTLAHGGRVR